MALRVLVDATAVPADRGGAGRYIDGLVAALTGTDLDLAVVCQRSDAERYRQMAPLARVIPGPTAIAHRPARLAWEQTSLPLVVQELGVDVLHSPYYTMPMRAPVPVVVTIHDATWISEPQVHSPLRSGAYRSAIRTAMRRARRLIVPSEATREELVRLLQADPAIIDVVHHGVDTSTFRPPTESELHRVTERLGLHGRPYVAFLGALDRRKNVPELVRGWMRAVADMDEPPALVLAGASGWDDEVEQAVSEVPGHLKIVRPGFLRPSDLPGLLGGALVLAYPSRTEGFGFPVLEAMACGAPVLTTRHRSLPEVGGDAVAYAEPDAEGIAACLRALIADPDRRAALGRAGRERARNFRWEDSAAAHVASYSAALTAVDA
ncbi:MAG: glycosyltransferase family 4 protein [Actinomycetota bacterium]|nr:glycosyltransferase family 4 protein [Actinomycetota bacterium]